MASVPQERQCKREGCPERFPVNTGKRGRPKVFCSDRCRLIHFTGALEDDVRRAWQSARKYESSLRRKYASRYSELNRREMLNVMAAAFLGLLLERWPHEKGRDAKREAAWKELDAIRHDLCLLPPDESSDSAKARASALQRILPSLGANDLDATQVWIHCEEIKRDAGVVGESEEALNQLDTQVKFVEQLWNEEHDHLNIAYALLSHAQLDRIRLDRAAPNVLVAEKHADQARHHIVAALNVLAGPCYKQDRRAVNILRHYATLLRLRLEAFCYDNESAAKQSLAEMQQFEEQVNERIYSPRTSIETLREKAGYCRKHDLYEANTLLKEANALFQELGDQTISAQLSLLRLKLEILYQLQDQSFEEEVKKYLALLQQYPNAYSVNQIRNLLRRIGKDSTAINLYIPTTIYTTPFMQYLYYEDFSLRRKRIL